MKVEIPVTFKIDGREIDKNDMAKKISDIYDSGIQLWIINVLDQEGYKFKKTRDGKKVFLCKEGRIVSEFSYEIGGLQK